MHIQPKPTPAPTPIASRPEERASPVTPPTAPDLPSAPTLPPHVWQNRTFAEMPDRNSPEWGTIKPQLTVRTDAGELAKIPKHPARMTEGELMERYFDPGYKFDTATGKSIEPFFTKPGSLVDSPTREMPGPWNMPANPAPAQPTARLWGGESPTPAPAPAQPAPGLWGGAPLAQTPNPEPVQPSPGLWGGAPIAHSPESEAATPPEEKAPLLPHKRASKPESPPQSDRFAGIEGWGRNPAAGGRNDYYGSDWD